MPSSATCFTAYMPRSAHAGMSKGQLLKILVSVVHLVHRAWGCCATLWSLDSKETGAARLGESLAVGLT